MSLTIGIGPLAKPVKGQLNADVSAAPAHLIYVHNVDKHIRGELAGVTIVDSDRTVALHETALLPQWYFPLEDVRSDVLVESEHQTHCPFKGDARYWHLRVGDTIVRDAVWNYPEPLPGAPDLSGLAGFYLDKLDAWYEEDEPILAHPTDPFHRVDTRRSSRQVTVSVRGQKVADTRSPVALFETGLPTRWYIPAADVDSAALTKSTKTTVCPYKGTTECFNYAGPQGPVADVAWSYPDPFGEALAIAGHLSFDGADVEVSVGPYDGR